MNLASKIKELQELLNKYTVANMIGKEFDFAPVKALCESLKNEDPERFSSFITDGTEHELLVSVSKFFMKLLNVQFLAYKIAKMIKVQGFFVQALYLFFFNNLIFYVNHDIISVAKAKYF